MKTKPATTPGCERLMAMVIEGLNASLFDHQKRNSARVALKRLRRKRCTRAIEYVMQVSCDRSPMDVFASEICEGATKYLNELRARSGIIKSDNKVLSKVIRES